MNDNKHTPGPWFIHDGIIPNPKGEGIVGTYEVLNKSTHENDVKVIGSLLPYGGNFPDKEEAHANAKLIVAAPDMYEIIKELYEYSMSTGHKGLIFPKLDAVMTKINS